MSVTSDELREALAARDRAEARLAGLIGEFDAGQGWDADAATSMVAWLKDHCRMSGGDAHRLVQVAKRVRQLPVTRVAWAAGELSSGQVQAISQHVGRKLALFAEHEPDVVPTLAALTLSETVEVLAEWRRRADAIDDPDDPEPVDPPSTLHLSPVLDRGRLDADLNTEDHAVVAAALRVADSGDVDTSAA